MSRKQMPSVDWTKLANLSEYELNIVNRFVKKNGQIRKSKPETVKQSRIKDASQSFGYRLDYTNEEDARQGIAAYVWRHVVFSVSPEPQHHCMPVLDFCYLPHGDHREWHDKLMPIIDAVTNAVPKSEWHGVRRWGQAFGLVGTAQVAEDGAIIYR